MQKIIEEQEPFLNSACTILQRKYSLVHPALNKEFLLLNATLVLRSSFYQFLVTIFFYLEDCLKLLNCFENSISLGFFLRLLNPFLSYTLQVNSCRSIWQEHLTAQLDQHCHLTAEKHRHTMKLCPETSEEQ